METKKNSGVVHACQLRQGKHTQYCYITFTWKVFCMISCIGIDWHKSHMISPDVKLYNTHNTILI